MNGFFSSREGFCCAFFIVKSDEGFSLIEALVALVIFSIAAIALLSVQSESSRAQIALEDKFLAEIVAENILVEQALSSLELQANRRSGLEDNGNRKWRWTIVRTPLKNSEFVKVQIDIADNSTGQVIHTLNTLDGAAE